jgi:hypothetical protein
VFTTGALQQFVYLQRQPIGRRAVVVGAEHVSFSAVLTLAHAGAATVAMTTEHARHQTYAPFKWLTATRWRVPIRTSTRVSEIFGAERVEGVALADIASGTVARLDCDTIVFTGDWIADHELARRGGLVMDAATRAPRVDLALRTSRRGVFAAGNLLHGAETADVAALGGRHAARSVHAFLGSGAWPEHFISLRCAPPLRWISPSSIADGDAAPPRGRFILRAAAVSPATELVVTQDSREIWRQRCRGLVPNLPIHVSAGWCERIDLGGGSVEIQAR